jgi:hypothetical protein
MKLLKKILIAIAILAAIPLVAAFFVKGEYVVTREIIIKRPKPQVFDYIKLLKNQNEYSVWNKKDPDSKMEYTGTDGTVGFISSWDSQLKDVGKGEQEIKNIIPGERLEMELRFKKPFESTDYAFMATNALDSNLTKVTWGFNGKMPYPMNILCLFMDMDKMLGPDLQSGLNNLKAILEKP